MTPDERRKAFADAFATQAASDWRVYDVLVSAGLPLCHQLHYLQMATEKTAKAYRIRDLKTDFVELAKSHTGLVEFVNAAMNSDATKKEWEGRDQARESRRKSLEGWAKDIERLAPAVAPELAPENAEYPWEENDRVLCPAMHPYSRHAFLTQEAGRSFLKLLRWASSEFNRGVLKIH